MVGRFAGRIVRWYRVGVLACMLISVVGVSAPASLTYAGQTQPGVPPRAPAQKGDQQPDRDAEGLAAIGLSVDANDRRQVVNLFHSKYHGGSTGTPPWSGSIAGCDAGTTTQAYRDRVLARISYYRAMAGVPASVRFDDAYNQLAQEAALMMRANNQLNHAPPSTWTCYSTDGYTGAGLSNLALGAEGTTAIDLYMRDPGDGNGAVGHRRWLLYPQTQAMGTGDVPGANALLVIGDDVWAARPPTRDQFVAWPPAGFVPYQIVFPRWSFAYPNADFSSATVGVLRDGVEQAVVREQSEDGYGENTVVWRMGSMGDWDAWPRPSRDTTYTVTIGNVGIGGQPQTFVYDVVVIDPAFHLYVPTMIK